MELSRNPPPSVEGSVKTLTADQEDAACHETRIVHKATDGEMDNQLGALRAQSFTLYASFRERSTKDHN